MRAFARTTLALAVLAMLTLAAGPGFAAGSNSDSSSSSASSGDPTWTEAKNAIASKDYAAALPLLQQVVAKDPSNADAFNYLGYINGRNGKPDEAIAYYMKALALKPDHRGANEYLGELYLKLGKLDKAKERLAVLDTACFFGCAEYDMLKQAVADYEATGKYTSRKGL